MPTSSRYVISSGTLARETTAAGGKLTVEERDPVGFFAELSKSALFESGLLPPGVLSIRQGGAYTQLVISSPPGIYPVIWGAHEGGHAETYYLAQPYKVVIGEFKGGALLGARMFYSPHPIISLDQPLYHTNVPNTNCRGYGNTGVGWVCLYHQGGPSVVAPLGEKVAYLGLRCSGLEAYNDGNMSGTDGTRFYREHRSGDRRLWDPQEWQKYSDEHGFDWTTDESLWLPIRVTDRDHQMQHTAQGELLSLEMAMCGNASFYYGDTDWPRPYNAKGAKMTATSVTTAVEHAYARAKVTVAMKEVKPPAAAKVAAKAKTAKVSSQ